MRLRDRELLSDELDGWLAIAAVLVIYGATEAVSAYGFLAAFAGGVAFRRYEHGHEYNRRVHDGAETVEKFGELALILLLGSSVTLAGLQAPGWTGWLLAPALLLVIRPASVAAALGPHAHPRPRASVRRLVRRARHRVALLRRGRRRRRRAQRRRGDDDRLDDDGLRDRLDRRPRHDRHQPQPPLAPASLSAAVSQIEPARCLHVEAKSNPGGDMAGNTRIPKAEITGVYGALVKRMSRKMLGDVPEPLGVMWHNRKVLNFPSASAARRRSGTSATRA